MNFLAQLLLIATVASTTVSALCFSGGNTWRDKNDAINKLEWACNTMGLGVYQYGEERHACWQDTDDAKLDFTVRRINGGDQQEIPLAYALEYCMSELKKEITGCNHGGSSQYDLWEFTSDPNQGRC